MENLKELIKQRIVELNQELNECELSFKKKGLRDALEANTKMLEEMGVTVKYRNGRQTNISRDQYRPIRQRTTSF